MSGGFWESKQGWVEPGLLPKYDWTANHYGSETEKSAETEEKL